MPDVVLAVDIGGTKTAVALADESGRIVDSVTDRTPATEGPQAVVNKVAALAAVLIDRADPPVSLRGAGVATAGVVDIDAGFIVSSTDTMTGWAGTPLAAMLRVALGASLATECLVLVQNDVDAHAIGEFYHGAALGALSALVVAVGTGVGAGIIIDGRVLRGARHVAGEIAHMPTPGAQHLRCPCGRMGHLEAIGSGVGLHRQYLWLGGDEGATDSRAVAARAEEGDRLAQRSLADSAAVVGRAVAAAVTLLDPDRVVVTGGVVEIGSRWWKPMVESFRHEVIDVLGDVPVVRGTLGADAPLRGAATSVWKTLAGERT